jgi:hypothetical protein
MHATSTAGMNSPRVEWEKLGTHAKSPYPGSRQTQKISVNFGPVFPKDRKTKPPLSSHIARQLDGFLLLQRGLTTPVSQGRSLKTFCLFCSLVCEALGRSMGACLVFVCAPYLGLLVDQHMSPLALSKQQVINVCMYAMEILSGNHASSTIAVIG